MYIIHIMKKKKNPQPFPFPQNETVTSLSNCPFCSVTLPSFSFIFIMSSVSLSLNLKKTLMLKLSSVIGLCSSFCMGDYIFFICFHFNFRAKWNKTMHWVCVCLAGLHDTAPKQMTQRQGRNGDLCWLFTLAGRLSNPLHFVCLSISYISTSQNKKTCNCGLEDQAQEHVYYRDGWSSSSTSETVQVTNLK